jgi:two-component system, OmpR family, phosphate regulon sensor histidine kinase PhoR
MNREKILEIIIENLPHGFLLVDRNGVIADFNRSAEEITAYSRNDVIGKSHIDIFECAYDKTDCSIPQTAFQQSREIESVERPLKKKNGEIITIAATLFPIYDIDGSFMGGVELFRDISAQKKKERERKNILSMFAHDMKNPVVIARGFLSRLLSNKAGEITPKQREYFAMIEDEMTKLHELITDFLQFSRFEAKEYVPAGSTFSLKAELSELVKSVRVLADKKTVSISVDMPADSELEITGDRSMINRVLSNLIDNAVKYSNPGGSVMVSVTEPNDHFLIIVKDNGIGIPAEHMPFIFDAFYRASKDGKGSGLGLFISKTIVEAHGGNIWAESKPLNGSSFFLTLPRKALAPAYSQTV